MSDLAHMIGDVQRGSTVADAIAKVSPTVDRVVEFKKTVGKLQIAYAEVYAPDFPDAHGDYMTADEIRKMAHGFLANGPTNKNVDVEHDNEIRDCVVVESFIARDGDPDFIPGSWVCGVHVADTELWKQVENGEINGFSMQGMGFQTEKTLLVDVPNQIQGFTSEDEDDGHWHAFEVRFNDLGDFIGGKTIATLPASFSDHEHLIKRGTVTEPGGSDDPPHTHRFSFVEGLSSAPI